MMSRVHQRQQPTHASRQQLRRACIIERDDLARAAIEGTLAFAGYTSVHFSYPDACLIAGDEWDLVVIGVYPPDPFVQGLFTLFAVGSPSATIIALFPREVRASDTFKIGRAGASAMLEKPFLLEELRNIARPYEN
jgi:DNA-binding response OmpR family regulator